MFRFEFNTKKVIYLVDSQKIKAETRGFDLSNDKDVTEFADTLLKMFTCDYKETIRTE